MEDKLKELLVERLFLEIDPAEIDTQTPLNEYGIDSFLLLELIVAIEEMFEVRFEPTDITSDTLQSIATIRDLINDKKAG